MRTALLFIVATAMLGCSTQRRIVVPKDLLRVSPTGADAPYVVRLTENGKSWEVELPQVPGGYEVHIPIGAATTLLVEHPPPGNGSPKEPDGKASSSSPQRSEAVAHLRALYSQKSYAAALQEVEAVLAAYGDDAKLLAMKGSLQWKLGARGDARKTWERVLDLEPENEVVQRMLEGME